MQPGTTALIVAHPGHELRLHSWLERERPRVFILTDGSGRLGPPRIDAARAYLSHMQAPMGGVFGRFLEVEFYGLLRTRDHAPLVRLAFELAESLLEQRVTRVVGDASEGFSSTHDAGRLITDAAVELAQRIGAPTIERYDFPVVHRPAHCSPGLRDGSIQLLLDDEAFRRKEEAAFRFYPGISGAAREAAAEGGAPEADTTRWNRGKRILPA